MLLRHRDARHCFVTRYKYCSLSSIIYSVVHRWLFDENCSRNSKLLPNSAKSLRSIWCQIDQITTDIGYILLCEYILFMTCSVDLVNRKWHEQDGAHIIWQHRLGLSEMTPPNASLFTGKSTRFLRSFSASRTFGERTESSSIISQISDPSERRFFSFRNSDSSPR